MLAPLTPGLSSEPCSPSTSILLYSVTLLEFTHLQQAVGSSVSRSNPSTLHSQTYIVSPPGGYLLINFHEFLVPVSSKQIITINLLNLLLPPECFLHVGQCS
ncbi:hypothetical protein ATANTOWER_004024, partial [Ataeniobius toweri]|nr:hypothetical protein [Ataeniobius toweri]